MRGDPRGISTAIALSKATMRTIRQNLFWAFFYNILLIPVAAGILYPVFEGGGVPSGLGWVAGDYGFRIRCSPAQRWPSVPVSVMFIAPLARQGACIRRWRGPRRCATGKPST
jgi:hypothetical protein